MSSYIVTQLKWLYHELGIASVYTTGRDACLIILGRACRMFAYGATSMIIALFFSELAFTDYQIGLFMTLTLAGDVLLSLCLTMVADRVGRRRVLLMGASLMVVAGLMFAISESFWILLIAAVVGVISATGSDFGPFRAIEESTLSHLTTPKTRSDVLSWYVATSILGSAAGVEVSGRVIEFLRGRDGWTLADAYHAIFWLYIGMGILTIGCMSCLSEKCEIDEKRNATEEAEVLLDEQQGEPADLDQDPPAAPRTQRGSSWVSQISADTRWIMYKLWFLLAVDSLADGMVSFSLTNYYIDRKFHVPKSVLGDMASAAYFLSFCSTVLAGPLARHLGLIKTMVFTHLPSSTAVLLFPAAQNIPLTVILLFIRLGLNNMDQAPRAAFIAAVVRPEERTAVNGITSTLRTLTSTIGPSVTGILAASDKFWIAFVVAGALRISYDLGLFVMFVNTKLHTHETQKVGTEQRHSFDEESILSDASELELNELGARRDESLRLAK
ncbi:major facilitator superfamily domain-containing protein [Xylariomycetidae sp. FL2044]|nr:major facilitator superfamily domain-containing protein [Xylariomycetidae sp. FL2044]